MLNNNTFYHGVTRKIIVAFGRLFSSIYIDRREDDSVNGDIIQRLQIPISYSNKEKWLVRLDNDSSLTQNTYTTLPRIAFEITGYEYDSVRKLPKMNKIMCADGTNSVTYTYTPVPYNISISLYILTKTTEDALQILEQILPTFSPEYTLSINAIPEMHIILDVPIILNNVSVEDEYENDFQKRRFVTHTLTFTLKSMFFGAISTSGIISKVIANVGENSNFSDPSRTFIATGDVETGEILTENWEDNF